MTDLDPSFNHLLNKKLLLFTGKGGVGKSFTARMTARKAASLGKRVLLIEVSHTSQHQKYLNIDEDFHRIQTSVPNLFHINIVYEFNFKDYVVKYLGMEKVFNQVFSQNLVRSFLRTVPGLNEITFLGRLYYECEINTVEPFDIVIFDGFASGHFHKLMTTPDGVEKSGLVGPVLKETRNIREFLSDSKKVSTVYVSNPEFLITDEVREFTKLLVRDTPLSSFVILLNRCLRSQPEDFTKLENYPSLKNFISRRMDAQRQALSDLSKITDKSIHLYTSHLIAPPHLRRENDHWNEMWNELGMTWVKS